MRDREFVLPAMLVAEIYLHLSLVGPDRYAVAHIARIGPERPSDRHLDLGIRRGEKKSAPEKPLQQQYILLSESLNYLTNLLST